MSCHFVQPSLISVQHVMNETLRLYPVVPFNVRLALKDTTLPHGGGADGNQPMGVLKDNPVGYSTLAMQRRPDLYPPPSSGFPPILEFVPERWDNWIPKSWQYIPFNGGPRICKLPLLRYPMSCSMLASRANALTTTRPLTCIRRHWPAVCSNRNGVHDCEGLAGI